LLRARRRAGEAACTGGGRVHTRLNRRRRTGLEAAQGFVAAERALDFRDAPIEPGRFVQQLDISGRVRDRSTNRSSPRLHVFGLLERAGEAALQLRHFALIFGGRGALRRRQRRVGIRSDRNRLGLSERRRCPANTPRQRRAIGSWRNEWTDAASTAET